MFLDEVIIGTKGGDGGKGCVSFRREKYVPRGGPDGGDGGKGGNIVLLADNNTDTLSLFSSQKNFKAENGHAGTDQKCHGKNGEDRILHVPPGTIVYDHTKNNAPIADLPHTGDQVIVAHGGRGGFGNAHFKSSVRQRPDFSELGEPGEEYKLHLELKLVADVGIIGYPSVGKSTLISVISAAKPKIAEYPFTTLIPNLGVVAVDDRSFVACDIPGIIEGASEGKGLGHQFLRHIERSRVLVHLLDAHREDLVHDYRTLRKELESYSPILAKKKELVVLNKTDLISSSQCSVLSAQLKKEGIELFATISAATRNGVDDFVKRLFPIILEERKKKPSPQEEDISPILRPHKESVEMRDYHIEELPDRVVIHGKRLEQFIRMTDFSQEGAVRRFRDVIDRIGLKKVLQSYEEMEIYIGEKNITEWI